MSDETREQLEADYASVFATPAGERVLNDLALVAGMVSTLAEFPAIDPLAIAAYEGKRRILLRIFSMLGRHEAAAIRQIMARRAHIAARTDFDPPPFEGDP